MFQFQIGGGAKKDSKTLRAEQDRRRREDHERAQREERDARRRKEKERFDAQQKRALQTQADARAQAKGAAGGKAGGAHDFKVVDMGSARGRVPLAARVKRVLDALHSASRPLRWLEVYELAGVDVRERELFGVLKAHDKVFFDEVDKRFTYKTKYDCRSKAELLLVLRGAPEGLPLADLKDCYKGVLEDVESLKEEGEIYVLTNNETRAQVAFPTRGVDGMGPPAPDEIVDMWSLTPLADAKRLRKVTNTHLMGLFEDGGAAAGEAAVAGPGAQAHR
eukprot:PRCOL_00003678-RA